MIPTYEQREAKYRTLSPERKVLYEGEASGTALRKLFSECHLSEDLYYEYSQAFGDVVLGFEREEQLPKILMDRLKLSEKMATIVGHDLLELLNTPAPKAETFEKPQPIAPEPKIPETPLGPPSWSKRIETNPQPQASSSPATLAAGNTPNYKKPMTDIPRYVSNDPYRESPK